MPTFDHSHRVIRYDGGVLHPPVEDRLAIEEPLGIRVAGRMVSVTMRTPGHDDELAAGFLVGEGILRSREAVAAIRPCTQGPDGSAIEVLLRPGEEVDLARLSRHVFTSSSCGICGAASLDAVRQEFPAVAAGPTVEAATIARLPEILRAAQPTFEKTGGLHAAGLFDAQGTLLTAREDVGRHNAVDKVVGHAFLAGRLPLREHVLLVSGRASFEIVQKARAAGIPIVAAVSAPSSLAVELAEESGITLVGFLRGGRFNVYTGADRLR